MRVPTPQVAAEERAQRRRRTAKNTAESSQTGATTSPLRQDKRFWQQSSHPAHKRHWISCVTHPEPPGTRLCRYSYDLGHDDDDQFLSAEKSSKFFRSIVCSRQCVLPTFFSRNLLAECCFCQIASALPKTINGNTVRPKKNCGSENVSAKKIKSHLLLAKKSSGPPCPCPASPRLALHVGHVQV